MIISITQTRHESNNNIIGVLGALVALVIFPLIFYHVHALTNHDNMYKNRVQLRLHRHQILSAPTPFHPFPQTHQETAHIGFIVGTHLALATTACTVNVSKGVK